MLSRTALDRVGIPSDSFTIDIDTHGASARIAPALPALRRGQTLLRLVAARTLLTLRVGLRSQSR